MNYTNFNVVATCCIKVDRVLRQTLYDLYSRFNYNPQKLPKGFIRSIRSFQCEMQAQKKRVSGLPSPKRATMILQQNEFTKEFSYGPVKSYDSNQMASNDPMEDMRMEAQCKLTSGLLMGVFDGHSGPACAQVVSKRIFKYIAASLLPTKVLEDFQKDPISDKLIETFNDTTDIVEDLKVIYEDNFRQYLDELSKVREEIDVLEIETCFQKSILHLDNDISREVLEPYTANGIINHKTLSVAFSGAVACVAYIDGPNLHIANVGDCNAVLGSLTEDDQWICKKITKEHNSENIDELKRIWSEHPEAERNTIIRRNRLLGELAPLRSLGDFRYKWPAEIIDNLAIATAAAGYKSTPHNYHTPPYLTSRPDVYYHRLTPRDKFLIIASDGIWDVMTPLESVKLVGEHMKGKAFFNTLKIPKKDIQLGDVNELLLHRKKSLKNKPQDSNAATHLIRHAMGGTEYGLDHSRLAQLLCLSPDISRRFRDDMTVTVIYFDSEYLRQCPA